MAKKTLSLVLAVLMIISLVPMSAIAAEDVADEVIYNLGSLEITVGNDTELAEVSYGRYKLFDESGDYTIVLEDNAFFPYEVQFQANGETFVEWFETPDSTVDVAGHTFSVYSENNDDTKLTQIGFWVDGRYVAAYPEAKEFANPIFAPRSMLPLQVKSLTLDLTGLTIQALESVELSALYAGVNAETGDSLDTEKAAWVKKSSGSSDDDGFQIAQSGDSLDMTPINSYNNYFYLEMIAGSAKQLDTSNVRYIIRVETDGHLFSNVDLYSFASETRNEVTVKNEHTYRYDAYTTYQVQVSDTQMQSADGFYVGLEVNSSYDADDFTIYKGRYSSAEAALAASAEDVTADFFAADMSAANAGYYMEKTAGRTNVYEYFTVVVDDSTDVYVEELRIYIYSNTDSMDLSGLYSYDGSNWNWVANSWNYGYDSSNAEVITLTLRAGYPANAEYYAAFEFRTYDAALNQDVDNSKVEKAVLGHYDSLAAATAQADIKSVLLTDDYMSTPETGYEANYSGDGVDFTFFSTDGDVYKFTVIAIDAIEDDTSPSQDTYFRVTGADGVSSYTMPYHADSYYNKGFQTVLLLNDTADLLDTLKPTFWNHSLTKMYASVDGIVAATEQASGITVVDFSGGAVVYTARAEDDTVVKNYNVSFVQQVDDARLFVNGPVYEVIGGVDAPTDPDKRELFLEDDSSYHDIFIANVGKDALTGLTVELSADAGAVKLDDYWIVGGAGNDELAGFTSINYNPDNNGASGSYNEISNVAKIRLVADGMGAIGGKLTISSDNGGIFEVYLTGVAGNPEIITGSLGNATKYVPYSVMVQTNNYNDSLSQSFSLASGSLPTGVSLLSNGEIYGVPTVAGTYTFTVKVSFDSDTFQDATKEFTLVVLDNTNTNVDAASQHTINVRVPATMTSYQAQVFEIDNVYADFMDFYLDGQKLTEGVHYDSEEGSTKITIRSQTFQNAGTGTHTIAAEFREDADTDKEMTAAAQNYTSNVSSGNNTGNTGTTTTPSTESAVIVNTPANGAISVSTTTPKKGDKVTVTVTPQYGYELESLKITDKDGKELDYIDNGDGTYTFTYGDSTVNVEATFAVIPTGLPFEDVFAPDWYLDAIKYAYEKGLLIGISETEFAPNMATSRSMMITVLHRIAGTPASKSSAFTDVPTDAWYADAVNWAAEAGIVSGIGNNLFAPGAEMTREQMAVMFYNFCVYMGIELPEVSDLEIADADKVSSWAIEAVSAMYKAGILNGKGEGVFDPKGTATRAEVAALLERFMLIFEEQASQDGDDGSNESNP